MAVGAEQADGTWDYLGSSRVVSPRSATRRFSMFHVTLLVRAPLHVHIIMRGAHVKSKSAVPIDYEHILHTRTKEETKQT